MEEGKKYWFPAKPPGYGWGWGLPTTWQGWLVVVVWFVLLVAGIRLLALSDHPFAVPLWGIVLGGALMGMFFWKGEPPGRFPNDRQGGKR
jgi:hypothetical protein